MTLATELILVVDDQESAREFLARYLGSAGHRTATASSVDEAIAIVRSQSVALVITDLRMPEQDGLQCLRRLHEIDPDLPVVVLTAYATVETAVQAMKQGAFEYLRKPIEPEAVEIVVTRALAHRALVEENRKLRSEIADRYRIENLVGRSAAMLRVVEKIRKVALVDVPVLITGESGTGKDLVARAIHGLSARVSGTFLSVNCAAVPDTLIEGELFGHMKGAFTGADRSRKGYFREADGGTLFLDEIGDLGLAQQAKLLRAIETGELIPVGSEQPVRVNVRVIAATHRDLDEMAADQDFRQDLLYRIETVRIALPPLRERREDIPLLVAHFLERARTPHGRPASSVSVEALRAMMHYAWPGNVRELAHAIDHAALMCDRDEVRPEDLPVKVLDASAPGGRSAWMAGGSFREARRAFEREYFTDLLTRAEGKVGRAADLAGIHRATLHEHLKALSIDIADGEA